MFDVSSTPHLLDIASDEQRAERSSAARKLIAVGRFALQRMNEQSDDQGLWCVDGWDVIAAEVGAELGISRGRASSQMGYGKTLIERLPRLAEVFVAGDVDFRVFAIIDYRTALITDRDVLARIDAAVARRAPNWNKQSDEKVAQAVDWLVIEHDPDAIRVARQSDANRHIEMGEPQNGMVEIWGSVRASDAAAMDRRLNEVAITVCGDDPRTKRQRRSDAMGAVATGQSSLACNCGSADCAAAATSASSTGAIVIHVLSEAATIEGHSDQPGFAPGLGTVPAETVREFAKHAKVKPVVHPGDSPAEPQYRPSAALAEFVRFRDLTCRFPGCNCPAEFADIDHTVPYPFGPTHPSNLKLLCRFHHLMKTFHTGRNAWGDSQLPDGTVIWKSPGGRTYTTQPHGALFFPQLAVPTGELILPAAPNLSDPARGLAMPTRRRTRAQERAARIQWERGLNRARQEADPPPF
ncbi:HNH endonuclease signature motif containing protein [Mycolicibacterium sp. XJ870]